MKGDVDFFGLYSSSCSFQFAVTTCTKISFLLLISSQALTVILQEEISLGITLQFTHLNFKGKYTRLEAFTEAIESNLLFMHKK